MQRAANNAYSWWWASHIRTKQSKWLEENLQDMEAKVGSMLQIVENQGDTFAQRSEMYFRKRPELINHVEESYRAYRALAERYDKISKNLQSANRTIATVFPEQIQYCTDEDEDDDYDYGAHKHKGSSFTDDANIRKDDIPKIPKGEFGIPSLVQTRKEQLNRAVGVGSARTVTPGSGLSKEEASEEIDKLQKEILTLQTEREFAQSILERCREKCNGIENQINEKQGKISNLQDEFGIDKAIDDNEARTLMAATALKSCQESLGKLQEKQEQSAGEAEIEQQKINSVHQKLTSLKDEFVSQETDLQEPPDEPESETVDVHEIEALSEKIRSEIDVDSKSSLTVTQLAERIDELVERVANLETAVSSQHAKVSTVRSETTGLQAQVKSLEEDKEILKENSEIMRNKLRQLEGEVRSVRKLNRTIIVQNKNLLAFFSEASHNVNHLSVKLLHMKSEDEVENGVLTEELRDSPEAIVEQQVEGDRKKEEKEEEAPEEPDHRQKLDKHLVPARNQKESLKAELGESGTEEEEEEEDHQPKWKKLFSRSLEDREKLLLEEYSSVLRNYKDVRKKLGDVEKKNREGFFELAMQIRELKNALLQKDEELLSLRKRSSQEQTPDETTQGNNTPQNFKFTRREESPESLTQATSVADCNPSSIGSPQETEREDPVESRGKTGDFRRYSWKESARKETNIKHGVSHCAVSAVEEKFRSDINDLLEDNLEFWLRFSSSFHQITKFQNSVHDLNVELSKLKGKMRNDGSGSAISLSLESETRPIYRHLREIETDLTLWLENSSVMKEEIQGRYASLCYIQEEIVRISGECCRENEAELSIYQAAKFQGEVLNMKQENKKVADELLSGLERVKELKTEVEKTLTELDEQLGLTASGKQRSTSFKTRIPLRSFLFGVKLRKKPKSIFSCVSPLQKQYSVMEEPMEPPK